MPALQACSACQFTAAKVHAAPPPPPPRRKSDTKVRDEAIKKCDIFPIMKHQFAVYDDHNDETIKVEAIGEKEKKRSLVWFWPDPIIKPEHYYFYLLLIPSVSQCICRQPGLWFDGGVCRRRRRRVRPSYITCTEGGEQITYTFI